MKTDEKDSVLKALEEFPVVKWALKKTTVSRATFYRWCEDDKNFKKSTRESIKNGILSINDMAEENLITMVADKELSAIKYWLSSHHSDYSKSGYIPVIYSKK